MRNAKPKPGQRPHSNGDGVTPKLLKGINHHLNGQTLRWLQPDDGVDVILNKVAVEQLINGLPNEVKVWVASRNPETPTAVAELIETYDSAHGRSAPSREKSRYQDQKQSSKPRKDSGKQKNDGNNTQRERRPLMEIWCYKCQKKGHFARNCTGKKKGEYIHWKREVNRKLVQRIQIDSRASCTVVNRDLVSPTDIGKETIVVTFGNGATGKYPLAFIKVKINKEYKVKAAVVKDLAEEVLLGRDVPLH